MSDIIRPYYSDEDYYHHNAPQQLSRWGFIMRYIMPFIVLAVICFLIYLCLNYFLQFMVEMSKPLCEQLICKL